MKRQILWIVLFFNLIALAGVLTVVALRPAKVRAYFSMTETDKEKLLAAKIFSVLPDASSISGSDPSAQASTSTGPGSSTSKTMASAKGPQPKSTPPPKQTPAKQSKFGNKLDKNSRKPTVTGVYEGPSADALKGDPPAPELYPFRIDRRTYPTDTEMEVEIVVQNASGYFWKNTWLILKSTDYPKSQIFKLPEWRIDELAIVRYRFPKAETEKRLRNLRVVEVRGERLESTLANQIGESRAEVVRRYGSGESVGSLSTRPRTSGLLGAWAGAAKALQRNASTTAPTIEKIEVVIDIPATIVRVPTALDVKLQETGPERAQIVSQLRKAHEAALACQAQLVLFTETVNKDGFEPTMASQGTQFVSRISETRSEFDKRALEVSLAISRSKDQEVKQLQDSVKSMSDSLVLIMDAIEREVRVGDPNFGFSKAAEPPK